MSRYAVFLSDAHGGVPLRPLQLRALLAAMPVSDVEIVHASGDVACSCDRGPAALTAMVQRGLSEATGAEARVVVLRAERLGQLLAALPAPAAGTRRLTTTVSLSGDPDLLDELVRAVTAAAPGVGCARLGPEAVAWTTAGRGVLAARRARAASPLRFRSAVTERTAPAMEAVRVATGWPVAPTAPPTRPAADALALSLRQAG